MIVPTRKERRKNLTKKKKNSSVSFDEFAASLTENIEIGKEIHNENIKEQEVSLRQIEAEHQNKVRAGLFEIYKDHKKVDEIMKKNSEINNRE